MINLATQIRAFLIADSTITTGLSAYNSAPAIFSRRPVPQDADYPMIVVSPQILSGENDYITNLYRSATYDVGVYALNDTATHYRECEETAFLLQEKFARLTSADFPELTGWRIAQATATGPIPFPTDDLQTVARGVTINFQLMRTDP